MPNNIVNSFSNKSGKSVDEVEKLWKKALDIAKERLDTEEENDSVFRLTTGILKRMLKLEVSLLQFPPNLLFELYTDGTPHRIRQTPINSTSKIFKRDSFLKRREDRDKGKKPKKLNKKDNRPKLNDIPGRPKA